MAKETGPGDPWLHELGRDLRLEVYITPGSARDRIMGLHDGRLKIQISAPPVDGQANKALVRFISELLGVPRAQVEMVGGAKGRKKTLRILSYPFNGALLRLSPVQGV